MATVPSREPRMAMVPSRAAPAGTWTGGAPSGLTGDRGRRVAATHHQPFGPATGCSMPRGPHRPYSNTQHLGTSSCSGAVPADTDPRHQLTLALWPFPMPNGRYWDCEYPDLYLKDPRLFGNEDALLHQTLDDFKLIIKFRVPLGQNGAVDQELIFYSELDAFITKHMTDHNLRFSATSHEHPGTSDSPMPAATDSDAFNAWHALKLLKFPWTTVALGNKAQAGFRRKLVAAGVPWYDFKISSLRAKPWTSLRDTINPQKFIYFIGDLGLWKDHCQHKLGDLDPDFLECVPGSCPPGDNNVNPQVTASAASNQISSVTATSSGPLFLDGANDSDEEANQLQQAIALSQSIGPSAASLVNAEAGPSHRTRLQSLTTTFRRRSRSPSSPRQSSRRRLEIVRSPSPIEIVQSAYRSVEAWGLALTRHLSDNSFTVTVPTTEIAVQALLNRFQSFYGGHSDELDTVTIEPVGEFGLLAKEGLWKCGESMGRGIGQNIMTELINEVFADRTVWKSIGDAKVLHVSPPGIPSDPKRLSLLRSYGYACRLFIITQRTLPPAMSVALAYGLLAPNAESDVINNPTIMRMYAPRQLQLLDHWAKQPSDFEDKKDDDTLREITLTYLSWQTSVDSTAPSERGPRA
ncbi:hypothetical protein B0H12DRAFT_1236286 [Mycena haematopus]|nr:hypothetical protein B0H12DRAFT_1236286 [Mycena haematopus]